MFGRKCRRLIETDAAELFDIKVDKSHRSAADFSIDSHRGGMMCAGAGGAITGRGANLLIIDDPVKNSAEANSALIRDNIKDWYRSTALTRLEPSGKVVLVMTRWHEDDLCGWLLNEYANDWDKLILPALSTERDILRPKAGIALWRERFNEKKLNNIKLELGSYWFSALYQQSPSPAGGGVFRREYFLYFAEDEYNYDFWDKFGNKHIVEKSSCITYAAVDLAARQKETSDYTAIAVVSISPNSDIFVIDMIRDRFDPARHLQLLQNVYERHRPALIGIESVQYQSTLAAQATSMGLPVKEIIPRGDKVMRSFTAAAKLEAGKIFFKKGADWLYDLEHEMVSFPTGKHDDQVDAISYVAAMVQPRNTFSAAGAIPSRLG